MKKNRIIASILVILFFFSPIVSARQFDKTHDQLNKKIEKIVANTGENLNIGILVQDLNTGKTLYQKNADRYFMPASNEKLLTAFAALEYLGVHFAYQTRLFADVHKIKNGTLKDHVYLQFSGDPALTSIQLDHLISMLSQKGVRRIEGGIIVDDTGFDQVFQSPGSCWDDQIFCFGSPLSPLIVDHNCVKAIISPAEKPGQPARIAFPSQPQFMYFINHVMTVPSTANECKIDVISLNETTYLIEGNIKATAMPEDIAMAIHSPRTNIQAVLQYLFKKNQITYTQPIKFQKVDPSAKLLASEFSPPLPLLIHQMLKESDNLIANALFKTLGSIYTHQAGNWQNGSDAVRNILYRRANLVISKLALADGAGESRYNYLTPEQIVMLLRKAYLSNHSKIFMAALPISGIDGTLKDRGNTKIARGKIHAKTGTMSAVSTLSGYLETQTKHKLVFSILINGFIGPPLKYRELQDNICTILIRVC